MAGLALSSVEPAPERPPLDPFTFRSGMRRLTGAVCVLTLRHGEVRAGLTATAVVSVSAEPPRLMVCINRNVFAHSLLAVGAPLGVNVLDEGSLDTARCFAGMLDGLSGEQRFQHGDWCEEDGVPVLEEALVAFQCRVVELIDASSHSMVLCAVERVRLAPEPGKPLLYFDGRFAALGEL